MISASFTANDFRYGPTTGIENSDLLADQRLNQYEYVDGLAQDYELSGENAYINAGIEEAEKFANESAANVANAQAEALTISRFEADYAARERERQEMAERKYFTDYAKEYGKHVRAMRDYELAA